MEEQVRESLQNSNQNDLEAFKIEMREALDLKANLADYDALKKSYSKQSNRVREVLD